MFRHGDVSTETDKKPFWFTLIAFAGSLTAAVLVIVFSQGHALGVFAGILLAVVAAASGAVLFAMVSDQAYIKDGTLYMRYLFRRTRVPLDRIGRLAYNDDIYSVYGSKGELLGTINAKLTGIDRLLNRLDQGGVRFD